MASSDTAEERVYSIADQVSTRPHRPRLQPSCGGPCMLCLSCVIVCALQVARFARAKEEKNERYLNIASGK